MQCSNTRSRLTCLLRRVRLEQVKAIVGRIVSHPAAAKVAATHGLTKARAALHKAVGEVRAWGRLAVLAPALTGDRRCVLLHMCEQHRELVTTAAALRMEVREAREIVDKRAQELRAKLMAVTEVDNTIKRLEREIEEYWVEDPRVRARWLALWPGASFHW